MPQKKTNSHPALKHFIYEAAISTMTCRQHPNSDSDGLQDADVVFRIMRDCLPRPQLEKAVRSEVALNLIPLTSDLSEPPTREDIELHFALLEKFMESFPKKAPTLTTITEGIVALDEFYNFKLSKAKFKKARLAWACVDAVSIRLRTTWSGLAHPKGPSASALSAGVVSPQAPP